MLLLIIVSLLLAFPAAAQRQGGADTRTWYQAYQDGRQQLQKGDWQAAITSLQTAKRLGPRPGRRIPFYGDVYDDFLPDYYLGLAYLNAGRYGDADAAFAAVRQSGLITARDREFGEFTRQSAAAAQQVAALNANTAKPLLPVPDDLSSKPPPAAAATTSPDSAAQQTQQGAVQAPTTNEPAGAAATPLVTPTPATIPPPPTPQVAVNETDAPDLAPRRPAATPVTRPSARPPAPKGMSGAAASELEALTAFYAGEYQRAADLLTALAGTGTTPRIEFYLACSRAALVMTGAAPPAVLTEAQARFARIDNAQFTADVRYISPRILAVLRSSR